MPIYEYACPSCGNEFETIHRISDPPPPCPTCGKGVQKKISLSAFHLKGGGWYSDAYAGKDNKTPGSSNSSPSNESSSNSSSSNESSSSTSSTSGSSSTSSSSDSGSSSSSSASSSSSSE